MVSWLFIGIMVALFYALNHLLDKKASEKADSVYVIYSMMLVTAIISLPVALVFRNHIIVPPYLLWWFLLSGVIIAVGLILFTKSIKHSQIGKTVPLMSLTPLVAMVVALFILREKPNATGIMGVILIVFGVYVLKIDHFGKKNFLEPLKSILQNKGSKYMLIVSVLFGFGCVIDKYIIMHSNIFTRVILYSYFVVLIMTVYLLVMDKRVFARKLKISFQKEKLWITLFTIGHAGEIIFTSIGLAMTLTAYIMSIKRAGIIFSVIFAHYLLKERKHFLHHLMGAAFLVAGAILVSLQL